MQHLILDPILTFFHPFILVSTQVFFSNYLRWWCFAYVLIRLCCSFSVFSAIMVIIMSTPVFDMVAYYHSVLYGVIIHFNIIGLWCFNVPTNNRHLQWSGLQCNSVYMSCKKTKASMLRFSGGLQDFRNSIYLCSSSPRYLIWDLHAQYIMSLTVGHAIK